ncbi:MAG TPA: HEAT repeat domain-containing protein [Candidatus Angelobacter sp.]|nr:HEAT repeat domain-containing protein [Candidatus Angelobacter sp.]
MSINARRAISMLRIILFALMCISTVIPALGNDFIEATGTSSQGPQGCPSLDEPAQLIDFLSAQRTTRTNPACIQLAITALGSLKTANAVPVLIDFLDFPEPLSPEQESARMLIANSHSRYAAIGALYRIGEEALPSIRKIVTDPSASPIKLDNALLAYSAIRRESLEQAMKELKNSMRDTLCPSLPNADDDTLISYLENYKARQQQGELNCIGLAIFGLGEARSAAAIKILLSYLDFEWPRGTNAVSETNPDYPLLYQQQRYPAVTALFLMGTRSLIPIMHQLQSGNLSEAARSKAIETIMLIYAEHPHEGISVIKSMATKSVNPASAKEIQDWAIMATRWCDAAHRASCEAALQGAPHRQ